MRKNLFLLIFLIQSLLLFSQNKITGFVVSNDKDIGEANINVKIKDTNYTAKTNKIGRFNFLLSDSMKNIKFELNNRFDIYITLKFSILYNFKNPYLIS